MIEFLIAAGIGALAAHAKEQTFEGKINKLQNDFKSGKLSSEQAQKRYQGIVDQEIEKIPDNGIQLPENIRQALESGMDYRNLKGIDPDTYNYLHAAYWHGEYDREKAMCNRKK